MLNSQQAAAAAQQMFRSENSWAFRKVPKLTPALQEFSKKTQVYIFNVGPWTHTVNCGSAGTFTIHKCQQGEPFSQPLIIPGLPTEPIFTDSPQVELRIENGPEGYEGGGGRYLAEQILGVGRGLHPNLSLVRRGCFIAAGPIPSKDELNAARAELTAYDQAKVVEARELYDQGPQFAKMISPEHRESARRLGMDDEVWMVKKNAGSRQKCEGCGTPYDAGIMICSTCRFIIDAKRYEANKLNFAK